MNREKFMNGLIRFAGALQQNKYISAISSGLMATLPLLLVGAIGSIFNNLGIPAWQSFLEESGLKWYVGLPAEVGTNMMALFAVFGIAYQLTKSFGHDGVAAGMIALMCFMFVTPMDKSELGGVADIPMTWLGASGLFTAMIIGLVCGKIYSVCLDKHVTIKMPDGVPPVVTKSFEAIIPALILGFLFLAIGFAFSVTPWESLQGFIYQIVALPLTGLGSSFPALLIAIFFTQLFWSFGIHGTMVALSVFMPIWSALDAQNLAAFNAGQPGVSIVCMQFYFLCAFAGGAGNTLGLILNMFLSHNEADRSLAKVAFVPGLFGINEPIIFGMPIVLNPIIIIPFIAAPIVTTVLGYVLCVLGIIAFPTGISSIAGAPIVVNQFIQGGWTWAVWELLVIFISFLIYMPFFRIYEKKQALDSTEEELEEKNKSIDAAFKNMGK